MMIKQILDKWQKALKKKQTVDINLYKNKEDFIYLL